MKTIEQNKSGPVLSNKADEWDDGAEDLWVEQLGQHWMKICKDSSSSGCDQWFFMELEHD